MTFTIYHNPRCRKSRAGLDFLISKGIEPEVRTYLTDPMTADEFRLLLSRLNLSASELVRTQEEEYRKQLRGKNFTEDEWIRIILDNPRLMKRPIVVRGNKAVWGDPAGNIEQLM